MTILWALLLVAVVVAFWFTNLLGLPGNWLILLAAVVYAWLMPDDVRVAISRPIVIVLAGFALAGELIELLASAAGVKKAGGSRPGALFALVGSVIGAMTGMVVGTPIPVVGSLLAALLFAGLGALVGAMLGEAMIGRSVDESWKVGEAAFWGRLFGTLAKTLVGAIMVGVVIAAVIID